MIYGKPTTLLYIAWNAETNEEVVNDAANHTISWIKGNTLITPTNSPTEVSDTLAKGVYAIEMTGPEVECFVGCLTGVSSTEGVSIIPVIYTFDRLPDVAPGTNGGLATVDGDNYIAGIQGTINTLDELGSSGGGSDMTVVELNSISASININEITFYRELNDGSLEIVLSSGVRITISNQTDKDEILSILSGYSSS